MLRLFVAVELPEHVQRSLAGTIEELRHTLQGRLRWVDPVGIHLTLKFMGDVPDSMEDTLSRVIAEAVRMVKPFELRLDGAGTFPAGRLPSVVWAGLAGDLASLKTLQAAVEAAMAGQGVAREPRAFWPHLTLARVRGQLRPDLVGPLQKQLQAVHYPGAEPFAVRAVSLMRSELRPDGARYTRLAHAPLALGGA